MSFTLSLKMQDLLKKCHTCMDQIISAKERQAAEANKAANNLLKEIESEKSREQTKKEAAAKKREKRKAKKKGKQQTTTATTTSEESTTKVEEEEEEEEPPLPPQPAPVEVEEHIPVPAKNVGEEDDPRLPLVKTDTVQQKSVSPERTVKQPVNNNNKKKTNTMTRKIERHQENLVSKTKQESTTTTMTTTMGDDGWQEVIGKQKKITVPHEQYARIVGRSGSNLNVLREVTGASIEVENKRAIGDKTILIKGNGDAIKHAYQLIQALLKNSETELMNLLPSTNKAKPTTTLMSHDHEDDNLKTQRINIGPRLQNHDSTYSEASSTSRINPRSAHQTTKKASSNIATRSTSSSAPIKTPQPLTSTGATWVNSNRSNRAISSSSTVNSITINPLNWSHPKPSSSHNKPLHSNQHYPYSTASNHPRHYPNNHQSSSSPPKDTHQTSPNRCSHPIPSTPSSLLVAASSSTTTTTGEYNPFASNILTTSIVDVLTKTKDATNQSGATSDESSSKMNFANVAKMNVPHKPTHPEPIVITMNESTSSPMQPDPKAAPGYRGLSTTVPIIPSANFDSLSPTSQLSRAPGSNRTQPSISPSLTKMPLEQNGQTGSSTASSTSSSPSSLKQQTSHFIQPQPLFPTIDQQKPFGPIGSHRIGMPTDEMQLPIPPKFPPNGPTVPPPPSLYQQSLLPNPSYSNRSSLNPSAPEFQGPLSSNIMNIARMMEQQKQQHQHQHQPPQPPPTTTATYSNLPPIRSCQQSDIDAIQHVQNQVLHFYHLQANQQQHHLLQQPPPPPPQLPNTLQIANHLASRGQLPQDTNQAAALVASYYYTNFLSRTQQTNNIPLSPNVNTNSEDIPLTSGRTSPSSLPFVLVNRNHSS